MTKLHGRQIKDDTITSSKLTSLYGTTNWNLGGDSNVYDGINFFTIDGVPSPLLDYQICNKKYADEVIPYYSDNEELNLGDEDDLKLYHTGTESNITNSIGNLNIKSFSNNNDITFSTTESSITSLSAIIDSSLKEFRIEDDYKLSLGSDSNLKLYYTGTSNIIDSNEDLYIQTTENSKNCVFNLKDGTGNYKDLLTLNPDENNIKTEGYYNIGYSDNLTISNGIITTTKGFHTISSEGGLILDYLVTINGGSIGDKLILKLENDNEKIIIENGTGNIFTSSNCNIELINKTQTLELIKTTAGWHQLTSSTLCSGTESETITLNNTMTIEHINELFNNIPMFLNDLPIITFDFGSDTYIFNSSIEIPTTFGRGTINITSSGANITFNSSFGFNLRQGQSSYFFNNLIINSDNIAININGNSSFIRIDSCSFNSISGSSIGEGLRIYYNPGKIEIINNSFSGLIYGIHSRFSNTYTYNNSNGTNPIDYFILAELGSIWSQRGVQPTGAVMDSLIRYGSLGII